MAETTDTASTPLIPGVEGDNLSSYVKPMYQKVMRAVAACNNLPVDDDFVYYKSYAGFQPEMTKRRDVILGATERMLSKLVRGTGLETPRNILKINMGDDEADIEDRLDTVQESLDALFERVAMTIDRDIKKIVSEPKIGEQTSVQQESNLVTTKWERGGKQAPVHMVHARNIIRPQLTFLDKIDNSRAPFVPKLIEKPNATVPLDTIYKTHDAQTGPALAVPESDLTTALSDHVSKVLGLSSKPKGSNASSVANSGTVTPTHTQLQTQKHVASTNSDKNVDLHGTANTSKSDNPCMSFPHPYGPELNTFNPTDDMVIVKGDAQLYLPLEDTPLTHIDTEDKLRDLVITLNGCKEFAIDLEAHMYRSFSGFVCLMQISTRTEDFIVDTLALRHCLHILNEPFTNPSIVKVLHGADGDILWLQRDFGIYVVNMFDTGQASRVLEMPRFALAYLLQYYCKVTVDKKYQLADWRMRPLPEEMIMYARQDTHYLLYVYDRMRAELGQRSKQHHNLVHATWNRSTEITRTRFEKDVWTETSYMNLVTGFNRVYDDVDKSVFKALYDWRDQMARDEDESVRYVIPNHLLFKLADTKPADQAALLAACTPLPPLVRIHAQDLVLLIKRAIQSPLTTGGDNIRTAPSTAGLNQVMHGIIEGHRANKRGRLSLLSMAGIEPPSRSVSLDDRLKRCDEDLPRSRTSRLADVFAKKNRTSTHTSNKNVAKVASETATNVDTKVDDIVSSFVDPFAIYVPKESLENEAEKESVPLTPALNVETDDRPAPQENKLDEPKLDEANDGCDMIMLGQYKPVVKKVVENTDSGEKKKKNKRQRRLEGGATASGVDDSAMVLSSMPGATSAKANRRKSNQKAAAHQAKTEAAVSPVSLTGSKKRQRQLDDSVETVSKKKKKKKQNNVIQANSSADNDGAFVAFDYNKKSLNEETLPGAEDTTTINGKRKRPKKDDKRKTAYDPYTQLEEATFKKDARASLNPKSGQKSMTYKYKSK
eukprot:CFRG4501T1